MNITPSRWTLSSTKITMRKKKKNIGLKSFKSLYPLTLFSLETQTNFIFKERMQFQISISLMQEFLTPPFNPLDGRDWKSYTMENFLLQAARHWEISSKPSTILKNPLLARSLNFTKRHWRRHPSIFPTCSFPAFLLPRQRSPTWKGRIFKYPTKS